MLTRSHTTTIELIDSYISILKKHTFIDKVSLGIIIPIRGKRSNIYTLKIKTLSKCYEVVCVSKTTRQTIYIYTVEQNKDKLFLITQDWCKANHVMYLNVI